MQRHPACVYERKAATILQDSRPPATPLSMPVPRHRNITVGTPVSIVLKADQRTGRQVQGTVAQLLTRGDHPRGVKVRLVDGRIGRVQQLATNHTPTGIVHPIHSRMNPEDHNPWQSSTSQGNPYVARADQQQPQSQYSGQPQQGQSYSGAAQGYYQNNPQHQNMEQYQRPPGPPPAAQGIQRSDTDTLLSQQTDQAEQIEHMQNYEATARETQDDKDQAQLQKEFPNVDSSLIAALYGDTKDLSATREMLQELGRS